MSGVWVSLGVVLLAALHVARADSGMPTSLSSCGSLEAVVTKLRDGAPVKESAEGAPVGPVLNITHVQSMLTNSFATDDEEKNIKFAYPYRRSLSCMDGRQPNLILGAPGAELGVFLLAYTQYVESKGLLKNASRGDFDLLLSKYFTAADADGQRLVDGGRWLTMHTDDDTLCALLARVRDPPLAAADCHARLANVSDWSQLNLTVAEQVAVLEAVRSPEYLDYVGCGHIRRLLEPSSDFDLPDKYKDRNHARLAVDAVWACTSSCSFPRPCPRTTRSTCSATACTWRCCTERTQSARCCSCSRKCSTTNAASRPPRATTRTARKIACPWSGRA